MISSLWILFSFKFVIALWQNMWIRENGASSAFLLASFSSVYVLPQIKPETVHSDRINCIISILSFHLIRAKYFKFYSE